MLPALIVAALALSLLDDPSRDERIARALELVRAERDAVAPEVLEALAAVRNEASLEALREATRLLETPAALGLTYGLIATFADDRALGQEALALLEADALGALAARRMPAAEGLLASGDQGLAALRRVLDESPDPEVRATALGPLLPGLRIEGTPEALELALAHWRAPHSGTYDSAVRTLAGFRRPEHGRVFERVLRDPATELARRRLVLDALAMLPGGVADGVLVRALDELDPRLRVAVIEALDARATPGCERQLEALTDSGAPEVRAAAWVALAGRVPIDARFERRLGLLVRHDEPKLRAAAAKVAARAVTFARGEALVLVLLGDEHSDVRAAAREACLALRVPAFVPALIAQLDSESHGRREAVREALVGLTAQDHGTSAARWSAWWDAEGSARAMPTEAEVAAYLAARPPRETGPGRSVAQFYGIPLTSDRVAFVIDASGSMSALTGTGGVSRIEVAKAQLREVLLRLAPSARFDIVWFADRATSWRSRLVERTDANLRSAEVFVAGRDADGGTALYDGLMAAWRVRDVEAIYLLSDGAPSAGRITDPAAILADVRERFLERPIIIHTIAVGTPSELLRALAEATGGVYRMVD